MKVRLSEYLESGVSEISFILRTLQMKILTGQLSGQHIYVGLHSSIFTRCIRRSIN